MSNWNRLVVLAVAGALWAVPAMADGRDRVVVQGPAPLVAHAPSACEYGRNHDGSCRAGETVTRVTRSHTRTPTTVRRVVRQAPQVRRVAASAGPKYDFSGFNGGVGSDIATGFASGGARAVIIKGAGPSPRFSGVPGRAFAIARARGGCCH